ncbi:Alpha-scruin [Papilio xuthus]|uniref:Alpha-scruin n=1 Tax=Papilio xuthus TaxID=66420 RepID=A0A194PEC4_PAPXU|nr:Alpha-scruin [Papilio xuthus]
MPFRKLERGMPTTINWQKAKTDNLSKINKQLSVGGSGVKHLTCYLQVVGSNPAMYQCVFRFPIYICTSIRRSYDEGKHRDATSTYLRRNSKICVKSTNPHLASVVDYGLITLELDNLDNQRNDFSVCSTDEMSVQRIAAFPFKSTPSGNLKVQSNQVVFQSSTVGVLLADPTQAKVKVKFEGKAAGEPENKIENNYTDENDSETQVKYSHKESINMRLKAVTERHSKPKAPVIREEHGKDLGSLGYAIAEPIDWSRVQLPKKQDLFQEFYRRILNYIHTDTIIHIGDEEFHCHQIVLQIYSSFFDSNNLREIELPIVPRVMRFFLPLVASRDFLELEPDEVMTFLKSNYICVTSEIEVLMAGVRWLYGNWPARRRLVVDIMRCIRFGLISPWQLVDIKRNPDNAEILEIVNEPEVQQMVDDGLAYVIIKYWYGNNSKNYYHWIDVLGLSEPAERNWIGEEKNHVTYKDFLKYLEHFMVPKEQMYQQMSMMQPPRRTDDLPSTLRGLDADKMDMRRPKMEFPLPGTLKGLGGDKDKSFPTMSEFFENRRKTKEANQTRSPIRSPNQGSECLPTISQPTPQTSRKTPEPERKSQKQIEPNEPRLFQANQTLIQKQVQQIQTATLPGPNLPQQHAQIYEPPEKDSSDNFNTTKSVTSSESIDTRYSEKTQYINKTCDTRHNSVAACYLAAATAALAGSRRESQTSPTSGSRVQTTMSTSRPEQSPRPTGPTSQNVIASPQVSLFNQSKESLAKINMNKLSTSILGPSNKTYIVDGSLFNWDRETVLVFGGTDPHTGYGVGRNTGKDIYRFDPVTNSWDYVGDLPEPRHHHSVAFLRGRVYLVGGADPRDDDTRGKSVVVSTVWSYEPVTRSWYSESGLAIPRKNFGLVVHRMALYAIGGQDKKGRVLRSVERFDPKTGSWSEVRSMGVARMAMAAVKYREYIWVAGGMTGEKKNPVCKVVECYNSKTNEWTEIYSLRFPRCFATLFAMNDKLYIIGGAGKITEKDKTPSSVGAIDIWDWKDRTWKQETEMSIPRHGHALAYLGTQLIIIGGVTTIYMRALSNVESFCCERGAWIRGVATLPSPLSGHGAVTLPPASLM